MTPIERAVMYLAGKLKMDADDINATSMVIKMMATQAICMRDNLEKTLNPRRIIIGEGESWALVDKLDERITLSMNLIKEMHDKYKTDHPGAYTVSEGPDGPDTDGDGEVDNSIGSSADSVTHISS